MSDRIRPGYHTVVEALRTLIEASAQAVGVKAMPIQTYLAARTVLDDVDAADARDRTRTATPDQEFDALLSEIGVMPQRGK